MLTPRALGPEREFPGAAVPHRGPSDTGLSRPGQLADTAGYQTRLEFSGTAGLPRGPTTRARSPWSAGRPRRISDTVLRHPGWLVDTVAPGTRARVTWESLSTLRAFVPEPESPGTAGRHRGPRDTVPSYLRWLVDPAGHRTQAQTSLRAVQYRRHWNTAPGPTRHWSSPQRIRAGRESSGRAGEPCRASGPSPIPRESGSTLRVLGPGTSYPGDMAAPRALGPSPSCLAELVDLVAPRTRARVAGRACRPRGPSDRGRVARESLSTPQALEHGPRSAGTSCRGHRTSGVGPSLPGELVNNAGHRPERKLPGSGAGYRGPLEKSASLSGELFDLAGYWNMARENWDSWLTPWTMDLGGSRSGLMVDLARVFGNESESPGAVHDTAGTCIPARVAWDIWSTPWSIRSGHESSGIAGHRTRARVTRVRWSTPQDLGPGPG